MNTQTTEKLINDFRAFIELKELEVKRRKANYPKKVRFKVDYYYKLMRMGLLPEDKRTEIIDGELIEIRAIGSRHASVVKKLNNILGRHFGETAIVSVQDPVRLNDWNEPQPDIALLRPRADFYAESHPTPTDVLLLIEVSDSTLDYDREIKIPLYAESSIPELWLVNLPENTIEVYTQPENGSFQNIEIRRRGETLQARTIENLSLAVNDILGAQITEANAQN